MNNNEAGLGGGGMDGARQAPHGWRFPFLGAAVLLTAMGLMGVFGGDEGFTDALFEPDYTISWVPEGGPLAEAGFLAGDSVVSVEGIPVVELGMYSRWPRSLSRAPGESITMVVERDGEAVAGEVVYRERPLGNLKLQFGALLVGLAFLWFGMWILFVAPSHHALRLAVLGLAAGLSLPSPSLGSWNGIRDHVHLAAMVLWLLLLFRFFLFFPKPKQVGTGRLATGVAYGVWIFFLGCLITELLFHPRFYHTFGGLSGLLMLVFFLLAVGAALHSWAGTPRAELQASGFYWILGGAGAGLCGVLLWVVLALLLGVTIPGVNWLPLLLAAIPVGMALAVKRHSEAALPE